MLDNEKTAVVEKQIERLHSEIMERIKIFSALWRTVILGIAGVLALSEKRDLDLILLLSPPLVVLVLAYWLNEQALLIAASAAIAVEEKKLNQFAGATLLDYETRRTQARGLAIAYQPWLILIGELCHIGHIPGCLVCASALRRRESLRKT